MLKRIVLAFVMNKFIKVKKSDQDASKIGIDVKGTIALSSTVILFLMGLSFLQEISSGNLDSLGFFAGRAAASAGLFPATGRGLERA